jgi:hypothetical protein
MDIYKLYRNFWDYAFDNPEKIKPNHVAIYSFSIEHCNRLGWKEKFGFPTSMVLEATGIKSYSVYKKTFDDLVEYGFINVIEYSKNQYSSNIIALKENNKANDKALDKALTKHITKQSESTVQSIDSIDKQIYNSTNKQIYNSLMSEIIISDVPQDQIDYFNVANAFFQLFQQNAIDLDVRWVHLDKLTYKRCVTPIRLLATSDNRTRDEMLLVFDLLKKDLFWKQNIQSTEKLREKFDQLITKAQNYGKTDKRVTSEPYDLSCFDD